MKDTLNRLARGEFMARACLLAPGEESIAGSVCAGEVKQWELNITGDTKDLKGLAYSDNPRVVLSEGSFAGSSCVLHYQVDATGLAAEDALEGSFSLVSNAGTRQVPFCFKVTNRTMDSSIGPIHNLFHFANLVQASEDEACRIFLRDDFEKVFIKNDLETAAVYRNLKGGADTRLAVEEFLIAVRKKQPVVIGVKNGESIRQYEEIHEDYRDVICLEKNTWGYAKLSVSCDAGFLELDTKGLTTDDFLGNGYELGFIIRKSMLHAGNNYAAITIGAGNAEVVWQLVVANECADRNADGAKSDLRKGAIAVTRAYIAYRTQKLSFSEWTDVMSGLIDDALAKDQDTRGYRLMQAQVYCMVGRREEAGVILEQVRELVLGDDHSLLYPYYLYVNTLYERNQEYTKKVSEIMHKMYEGGQKSWQLLWMLFYVDGGYYDRNKSLKLARIKELFHGGCHSPVMYIEACDIINEQPMLLRVFDEFERQIINFGCRYDIIHERLASQICQMGAREKSVSLTYLRGLRALYARFGTDEILTCLCEHMIRNQMTGVEYFDVYELGVLRGLRITRLYECYMDSLPNTYEGPLPKILLMYFARDNQLNDVQKAFLYVNVIENFEAGDPVRMSFARQMEQFAIAQLSLGNISENLVRIYKQIWNDSLIRQETAVPVARLMFAYKLTCQEDGLKNVIVTHKELVSETVVPVIDNVAYVSIYTEGCSIAFEDAHGNRRANVRYALERLMEMPDCVGRVFELIPDDIYLSVYHYEKSHKYKMLKVDVPDFWEGLLDRMEVSELFACELTELLIDHYYNYSVDDSFKEELPVLLKRGLSSRQSARLLEACIVHGLDSRATDIALRYGTMFVEVKKLYRLCHHMLSDRDNVPGDFLVNVCRDVFERGQYDEEILGLLQLEFSGTTDEMYRIWNHCRGFETGCYELSERIVAQMLFTGDRDDKLRKVFAYYCEEGAKERIVEAYLSNEAYIGFVRRQDNDCGVYKIMEGRLQTGEDLSDLCKLSLLYDYSARDDLEEPQQTTARLLLTYFANKDMLFAFFGRFAHMGILPLKAMDKTVVEYRGMPGDRVVLHYLVGEGREEFCEEPMRDVFMGTFIKTFTLFRGETVQYYITAERGGEVVKTEMATAACSEDADKVGGRYGCLNDMLSSRDAHDLGGLDRLMKAYCVEDYITRQLFKIR